MKSVCVFCGSSTGNRPEYSEAALELGNELVRRRIRLVYGGSSIGLMGLLADTVLAGGGEVVGVIPQVLVDREVAHRSLADLRITRSMHERKATMAELSDGFVALPGGLGTLEEFAEVLTWSQLGLQDKPCALLDVAGYYQGLLGFFDHAVAEGFVRPAHRATVLAARSASSLLDEMTAWRHPRVDKFQAAPLA